MEPMSWVRPILAGMIGEQSVLEPRSFVTPL